MEFNFDSFFAAVRKHNVYFEGFSISDKIDAIYCATEKNLRKLGVVFTGNKSGKMRVSKRFHSIVNNYLEAFTLQQNGLLSNVILMSYINNKSEWAIKAAHFIGMFSDKEKIYVNSKETPSDIVRILGIRGHAIARYQERKENVAFGQALTGIYRIVRTAEFEQVVAKHRKTAIETEKSVNFCYIDGVDEIRAEVDSMFDKERKIHFGQVVIIHTYINNKIK